MRKVKNGFIKNLHYLCLIGVIALGLMAIVGTGGGGGTAAPGTCVNVAGTWNTTEGVNGTDCGEGTYTEYNTYTVTQDGCNITVMLSTGATHSGTVNDNQINWTGSWEEDGGTTTANISLAISGDSLSGSSSWTWRSGTDSCIGTTQITGTRSITPTTPTTGTLKITNNTSKSFSEVYFSPTTSTTWGNDLCSYTISPGQSWTLTGIPPDDYDLKVVFSDNTTYEKWDISIVADQTYTLELTDTNIKGSLKIQNDSSFYITEVYLSPTTSDWGNDQCTYTINPGQSWTLTDIPAGDYYLKVVASDGTTYTHDEVLTIVGGLIYNFRLYDA